MAVSPERSPEEILYQKLILDLAKAENGVAALMAAEVSKMCKQKGERDTEFVKRIARAYNQFAIRIFMIKEGMEPGELPDDLVHGPTR